MKLATIVLSALVVIVLISPSVIAQTYTGTQMCQVCHSGIAGNQFTNWQNTLHSKIHLVPDTVAIRPLAAFTNGDSINMGSSYGNAKVYLRRSGNDFYATLGAGGPEYKIAFTYGWGFKQRYLVKIDTSYYMLPIQYNLKGYMDNSTGSWVTYNPGNWFNSDGSLKSVDNTFRTKSWDKNCMGCHVTGGKVKMVVAGADTSWHATWANNSSTLNMAIGCEACHGPYQGGGGRGHQMNPSKLTTKERKLEVCGQCHNRAESMGGTHEYPKNEADNTYFNPADSTKPLSMFLDMSKAPNTPGGPGTWPDLLTARQHHQQYQEFLGSAHYNNPFVEVVCFTCHDPHPSVPGEHLLRDSITVGSEVFAVDNDNNTLCLSCHATHGPFANIPKAWVHDPVTYKDSIGFVVNQHSKHSVYDPENNLSTGGIGRCSKCHLAKTATSAKAYDIHSHRFEVISPVNTLNYQNVSSPTQGMLNTCAASCHRNPSGGTASVPTFGIGTDPTLTDWREPTDIALADTLWRYWQNWGWTGVKEVKSSLPIAFNLYQNYPNPFNPSTKIVVDLPRQSTARLDVYNIIGEKIATLMDGDYKAGRFEVTWSGKDDLGYRVPTGIYFYKLEAGNYTQTKKMMFIK
jgi:predicted CXXCH cytochrome family protein